MLNQAWNNKIMFRKQKFEISFSYKMKLDFYFIFFVLLNDDHMMRKNVLINILKKCSFGLFKIRNRVPIKF